MQKKLRSSWPRDGELTEAHHQREREPSYSDWLCMRADRVCAAQKGILSQGEHQAYLLLVAEHLADDYASKRHMQGFCIVWGCDRFAATELSLRCAEHQTADFLAPGQARETDELGPYGLDDASSADPYRDWIDYGDNPVVVTEEVAYRMTRRSRIVRSYTAHEIVEGTTVHTWESDSLTTSR